MTVGELELIPSMPCILECVVFCWSVTQLLTDVVYYKYLLLLSL